MRVLVLVSLEPGRSRARYFPRDMLLLTTTARGRAWRFTKNNWPVDWLIWWGFPESWGFPLASAALLVYPVLSIATKMVSGPPVRGILHGGQQVSSTILMYTAKRGRGTILVAIESASKKFSVHQSSCFFVFEIRTVRWDRRHPPRSRRVWSVKSCMLCLDNSRVETAMKATIRYEFDAFGANYAAFFFFNSAFGLWFGVLWIFLKVMSIKLWTV